MCVNFENSCALPHNYQKKKNNDLKMKIRVNELAFDTFGYLFVVQYICWVNGSEFPERECCDTIYSSPPNPEPVQPTRSTPTLTQIDSSAIANNYTGELYL